MLAILASLAFGLTDPCGLLARDDIARALGWSVASSQVRTYKLGGGAGRMCTFAGQAGAVIVTVASKGRALPDADMTSDLGSARTPLHDATGFRDKVELGRNSAIVHDRGNEYGINVQPIDAQFADETQMRALVSALVRHLPHRAGQHT